MFLNGIIRATLPSLFLSFSPTHTHSFLYYFGRLAFSIRVGLMNRHRAVLGNMQERERNRESRSSFFILCPSFNASKKSFRCSQTREYVRRGLCMHFVFCSTDQNVVQVRQGLKTWWYCVLNQRGSSLRQPGNCCCSYGMFVQGVNPTGSALHAARL